MQHLVLHIGRRRTKENRHSTPLPLTPRVAIAWRATTRSTSPAHDRQACRVRHGDEAENAEENVRPFPESRLRNGFIVQHGL